MSVIVLREGTLAFWDTFAGLVPCRVESITNCPPNSSTAHIELTAGRKPYKCGEVHEVPIYRAVPREAVRQRKGCMTKILPYTVHYLTDKGD